MNTEPLMENILVIDDDRELCELLGEYLKPEGFEVEAAYKGETGIEKVLSKKILYRCARYHVTRRTKRF